MVKVQLWLRRVTKVARYGLPVTSAIRSFWKRKRKKLRTVPNQTKDSKHSSVPYCFHLKKSDYSNQYEVLLRRGLCDTVEIPPMTLAKFQFQTSVFNVEHWRLLITQMANLKWHLNFRDDCAPGGSSWPSTMTGWKCPWAKQWVCCGIFKGLLSMCLQQTKQNKKSQKINWIILTRSKSCTLFAHNQYDTL